MGVVENKNQGQNLVCTGLTNRHDGQSYKNKHPSAVYDCTVNVYNRVTCNSCKLYKECISVVLQIKHCSVSQTWKK